MSEFHGLNHWLPQLIQIFEQRNSEIPFQLQEAEERCARATGEGGWCGPYGIKHVLEWEKELINSIENLIHQAVLYLDCPGSEFTHEFRELVGMI
jgi:hypothetical protein